MRFRIIAHAHCPYQNKPTSKTPHLTQRSSIYLLRKPKSNPLCPKFRCRGNEGRSGKNRLAPFNGPSQKPPPLLTQKSCRYFLHRPSYSQFCPKFRCHGNGGRSGKNAIGSIQWPIPENPLTGAKISQKFLTQAEL